MMLENPSQQHSGCLPTHDTFKRAEIAREKLRLVRQELRESLDRLHQTIDNRHNPAPALWQCSEPDEHRER